MRPALAALLLVACAHRSPAAPSGPARDELSRVTVSVAPETLVNDPMLADRGAQLRAALAKALADEGFQVGDAPGALVVATSIDYAPWTSVSAASLYIVVRLLNQGVLLDQVEVQKLNEAFPEPDDLARSLAHSLATSPRLRDFLKK